MLREKRLPNDYNYSFYQLSSIINAAIGFAALEIGPVFLKKYGAGTAVCSILVGNLIVWLIGVVMVSMMSRLRMNAIDNIKVYIGKWGAFGVSIILLCAFFNWFAIQIYNSIDLLEIVYGFNASWTKNLSLKLGAALGFFVALFAIGGLSVIKKLASIALPALIAYQIYLVATSNVSISFENTWGLSIPAIMSTALWVLPGMINLPTIFRHSRSRADSYLALTFMAFIFAFFEISMLWLDFTAILPPLQKMLLILFIFITSVFCNLLNIYFASACLETIVPRFEGAKGFAIIGLIGTALYTFIQILTPIQFLEGLATNLVAILGYVLLVAFLMRTFIRHRPRAFEKLISGLAWGLGCIAAFLIQVKTGDSVHALLLGIGVSTLFFLFTIFIEETRWAIKKLQAGKT